MRFGLFELHWIETGDLWLDGGAMFGVVPKALWSRQLPPDDDNRIPMTMRCLLIRSLNTKRLYLIDNGAGNKFNDKMSSIYGFDYGEQGEKRLDASLTRAGVQPSGSPTSSSRTCISTTVAVLPTTWMVYCRMFFPMPFLSPRSLPPAIEPNPREQASFLPDSIGPIAAASDRLSLVNVEQVNSNQPCTAGLEALVMNGHTIGQQLPKISSGNQHLVFVADLLPTAQHLPLVWVMGYDMFPTQTLQEKQTFLEQAAAEQWWLLMQHDRYHECIQVGNIEGRWKVIANSTLNDLAQ